MAKVLKSASWQKTMLTQVLWVSISFIGASLMIAIIANVLQQTGFWQIDETASSINLAVLALGSSTYLLMLAILIGLPQLIRGSKVSLKTLGLNRLPQWRDLGITALAVPIYVVFLVAAMALVSTLLPTVDLEQAQDIGLSMVSPGIEMWLVFLLLVVLGPVVEELVFRGYLYGKLRATKAPVWLIIVVSSALFGAAHMQWNVAIDTFILGAVMCVTREIAGSIWPAIMMHMLKNGLAFYFLFVAGPSLGL